MTAALQLQSSGVHLAGRIDLSPHRQRPGLHALQLHNLHSLATGTTLTMQHAGVSIMVTHRMLADGSEVRLNPVRLGGFTACQWAAHCPPLAIGIQALSCTLCMHPTS